MSDFAPPTQHILISINPKAGRKYPKERVERLQQALISRGASVELYSDLVTVTQRANELFNQKRLKVLIGVGGDGTASELTNRTQQGVPITLFPSGTANLIAKYLKLPFNPEKFAEMIITGDTIELDAGKANGRLFLVMASVGIDAEVVKRVHQAREDGYATHTSRGAHISYWSYLKPIIQSIKNYKYPKIKTEISSQINSDDFPKTIIGKWGFVFNLPQYGWGLPLVPRCTGADQQLDYCVFQGGKFFTALLEVLCAQLCSMHRFLPNAKLGQGTKFRLTTATSNSVPSPIPYQLDGDPGGFLPLDIEIAPKRFTVLVPPKVVKQFRQ